MEFLRLPDDVLEHVLRYLPNTFDRIALAFTCTRLQQLCHHRPIFKGKVDPSFGYKETQLGAVKEFFKDKLMAHRITELHLNYCFHMLTDANLEDFVIASCPQLQVLHIIDCGMSIRSLHRILQRAHKLTTLSWSMVELSPEDIEFMVQNVESNEGVWLENIKNLWIKTAFSKLHMEILRYLLLCRCKCVEKIRITFSEEPHLPYEEWNNTFFPRKPSSSETDALQHLYSLDVASCCLEEASKKFPQFQSTINHLSDIAASLKRKQPCEGKWKQLLAPPPVESFIVIHFDSDPDFIAYCKININWELIDKSV